MEKISIGMQKFLQDEQNATSVEYKMIIKIIPVAVIVTVTVASIGAELKSTSDKILACLQVSSAATCTG